MNGRPHYRFEIRTPIDRDAKVLVLLRYTPKSDTADVAADYVQEVLTVDGWHEYRGYEQLPYNLPEIQGVEMLSYLGTMHIIDQFEKHIRTMLKIPAGRL